jgi:hypothetical protein
MDTVSVEQRSAGFQPAFLIFRESSGQRPRAAGL